MHNLTELYGMPLIKIDLGIEHRDKLEVNKIANPNKLLSLEKEVFI